uniref:EF-hand domain-containing protein n=1 Tax=Haptolina brevifila TaxID=156173 RepID=A0A7S2E3N4_9EUKA
MKRFGEYMHLRVRKQTSLNKDLRRMAIKMLGSANYPRDPVEDERTVAKFERMLRHAYVIETCESGHPGRHVWSFDDWFEQRCQFLAAFVELFFYLGNFGFLFALMTFQFANLQRGEEDVQVRSAAAWQGFAFTLSGLFLIACFVPLLVGSSAMWRLWRDGPWAFMMTFFMTTTNRPVRFDTVDVFQQADELFHEIDQDGNNALSVDELKAAAARARWKSSQTVMRSDGGAGVGTKQPSPSPVSSVRSEVGGRGCRRVWNGNSQRNDPTSVSTKRAFSGLSFRSLLPRTRRELSCMRLQHGFSNLQWRQQRQPPPRAAQPSAHCAAVPSVSQVSATTACVGKGAYSGRGEGGWSDEARLTAMEEAEDKAVLAAAVPRVGSPVEKPVMADEAEPTVRMGQACARPSGAPSSGVPHPSLNGPPPALSQPHAPLHGSVALHASHPPTTTANSANGLANGGIGDGTARVDTVRRGSLTHEQGQQALGHSPSLGDLLTDRSPSSSSGRRAPLESYCSGEESFRRRDVSEQSDPFNEVRRRSQPFPLSPRGDDQEEVREKETAAALALLETIIHRMQGTLQEELREQRLRKLKHLLRPGRPLPLSERASGLKWVQRDTKPLVGTRLRNRALERALLKQTEFSREEWRAFRIEQLRFGHYVKSGDAYFKPVSPDNTEVEVTKKRWDEQIAEWLF